MRGLKTPLPPPLDVSATDSYILQLNYIYYLSMTGRNLLVVASAECASDLRLLLGLADVCTCMCVYENSGLGESSYNHNISSLFHF